VAAESSLLLGDLKHAAELYDRALSKYV